ncbi:serine hydrolase domain-containing protein [Flavobacterium terrae]|uniref:CubicO group peptidase, beta-lactamase class C family n=1 Tax=Flavobacterium terrae TaxID=415425 RepID=A0A1M6CWN3_9FLAO|nr:serine hydrolase domain-containing protein [Flavobacterium terrae]SHI65406.1 CubicO group peptidase, beta-lactamase class C family [Flavobacterium terrae]
MKFDFVKFRNNLNAMMQESAPDGYRFICVTEELVYLLGDTSSFDQNKLESKLKTNHIKIGKNSGIGFGSGGARRTAIDPPQMTASINDRFNVASMSKTITAATVLNILQDKDLPVTTLVKDFLPSNWKLHPTVQTLTFQDFLTHRTGFTVGEDGHDFAKIKSSMELGPTNLPKKNWEYRNINYSVFRVIIPLLNSYNRFTKQVGLIFRSDTNLEEAYANEYMRIVNERVLIPSGVVGANCNSRGSFRGLETTLLYEYQHSPKNHGYDYLTNDYLYSGAHGWAISVVDFAKFVQTFLFTEIIVSDDMKKQMLPLLPYPDPGFGMYANIDSKSGNTSYGHGGWIPFSEKIQIASWWLCFKNNNLIVVSLSNAGHKPPPHPNWSDSCIKIYNESWSNEI